AGRRPSSRRGASRSWARATRASAEWSCASTRTRTRSSCTGGTRRMSRAEALERYRKLPVPDTTEEHWRFTDLKGFDPEAFAGNGAAAEAPTQSMLELDVAGVATVTETGIEISRAPDEIRFEPLDQAHSRLGELVGWRDDKFAAHHAAVWEHGLL